MIYCFAVKIASMLAFDTYIRVKSPGFTHKAKLFTPKAVEFKWQ